MNPHLHVNLLKRSVNPVQTPVLSLHPSSQLHLLLTYTPLTVGMSPIDVPSAPRQSAGHGARSIGPNVARRRPTGDNNPDTPPHHLLHLPVHDAPLVDSPMGRHQSAGAPPPPVGSIKIPMICGINADWTAERVSSHGGKEGSRLNDYLYVSFYYIYFFVSKWRERQRRSRFEALKV